MSAKLNAIFPLIIVATVLVHDVFAIGPAGKKLKSLKENIRDLLGNSPNKRPPNHRNLQDLCYVGIASEVKYEVNGVHAYKPSFYESCAENLVVDSENMLLHIYSLNAIFEQYHCFYDLAKDPQNSDPNNYQPELGNTIFAEGGGAVDLEAGLRSIFDQVLAEGANMTTFWDIERLFNQLYDGHVALPAVEEDFYSYRLIAIPERYVGASNLTVKTEFYFDDNQQLQVDLTLEDAGESNAVLLSLDTINAKSVHDFIVDMADNPAVGLSYQTTGARVNALLMMGLIFKGLVMRSRPSEILPDSFEVIYTDGTSETYVTLLAPFGPWYEWEEQSKLNGQDYFGFNAASAEAFINKPGSQFDAFQQAVFIVPSPTGIRKLSSDRAEENRELQGNEEATIGAFLWNDNVDVFKIQSFTVDPFDLLDRWNGLVLNATLSGQTKLIIDLSSNSGGSVINSYWFLFCLFPEVPLEWFLDQWDSNWNLPMTEFLEGLLPLLDAIIQEFDDSANLETLREELQTRIDSFTQADFDIYTMASTAMVKICSDVDDPLQCDRVKSLAANVTAFVESPSLDAYADLLVDLIFTLGEYNPFSVVGVYLDGSNRTSNETISAFDKGSMTVIRGGVESNITNRYNSISSDLLKSLQSAVPTILPFDEYIFVSDGTAASAAAIVSLTAAQLYRNRDRTGVQTKVRLLGYGGTGNAEDLAIGSAVASVDNVHLDSPIIGDIALSMLIYSLPRSLNNYDAFMHQASVYSGSVAIPPYFGNSLPSMPIRSFYDRSMDTGALPLQFVNISLDEYIPKLYLSVTMSDSADLAALYNDVATFF